MSKLPFNRAIFWKVFIIVMVLVVGTFTILFFFTSYRLTNADKYGSLISALILSYLVHLWLLPPEYLPEEDCEEAWEGEDDDEADDEADPDEPLADVPKSGAEAGEKPGD